MISPTDAEKGPKKLLDIDDTRHHVGPASLHEENLNRGLSSRQISMIAIGGTIGSGLFLGTGKSLATGGPASLVITYAIVGFIVYLVMLCLGEMATEFPVAGSFTTYATRFVNVPFGFAIGWIYFFNDSISVASDLTAATVLMEFWNVQLNWLPALIFLFFVLAINLIHVRAYGELEYWLSLLKVVTIVIFIILSIAVNAGANTEHRYIGVSNWTIGDAPFVGGFGGFASLFVTASYAYGGTESIGVTAGETRNPTRNVPRVIRRVFWRILIFYFLTTLLIGFNIPYNYPGLSTRAVTVSPFTLVFAQAGAKAGGSFMNAVILTSVISAANHASFAGSRILYGLAVTGQAPAIFQRTSRTGVPYLAVVTTMLGAGICFGLSFLPGGAGQLFVWLQALVGVSNQIAWWSIGIASWRFRSAWKKQGRQVSELRFPNPAGKYAAPMVVIATTIIILVQGWSSFAPFDTVNFLQSYIDLPLFAVLYLAWWAIKRTRTPSTAEVDLVTSRYVDTEDDAADNEKIEQREHGKAGIFWRLYSYIA